MDEFLALAYHEEFGLETVIVRLFNTVGPRQTGMYGMVVPRFVERALRRRRDRDLRRRRADTLLLPRGGHDPRAPRPDDRLGRTSGEIFNVGANNQISILDLAERIKQMTDSSSPLVHVPFDEVYGTGIEDMLHRVPCIDKVRETIGWAPRTLDDILGDVVAEHDREGGVVGMRHRRRTNPNNDPTGQVDAWLPGFTPKRRLEVHADTTVQKFGAPIDTTFAR